MLINDNRFKQKELTWGDLEPGKVYISSQKQKYGMFVRFSGEYRFVCLETGFVSYEFEHSGDVFTLVEATLEIN